MQKNRKLIVAIMSFVMLISAMFPAISSEAAAISAPSKITFYLDGSKNQTGYITIDTGDWLKSTLFSESSIKIKNKKIATLNSTYGSSTLDEDGATWYNGYVIELKLKKPGTTTVSYKIGSKTYKTKITVAKYINPLKSVKITKVKSGKNIANKLIKSSTASAIKLSKTIKNSKLTLQAKSGWKIASVSGSFAECTGLLWGGSKSKLTIKLPDFKKGNEIRITMKNTKTGGTITCKYTFK